MHTIRALSADELADAAPALADVLIDAVESGAGVSFLWPLARDEAEAFWRGLVAGAEQQRTIVLVAEQDGRTDGTVTLMRAWPPNQPHRCDLAKLLVHRRARRQGVGAALVAAFEAEARRLGLTLITFDAVAGGNADRLYQRLGFTRIGEIPGYALDPYGKMDATAIFYKQL